MAANFRGPGADLLIDLKWAATCLACPVPHGCVYEVQDITIRCLCPVWQAERERENRRRLAKRGRLAAAAG